ncbi:hypothetical protein B0H21DRAFT_720515 [Amylocystis lapponica]|nr:hypothetical protein B0H21DRAFT_720515 [Amylocystis lapponica]
MTAHASHDSVGFWCQIYGDGDTILTFGRGLEGVQACPDCGGRRRVRGAGARRIQMRPVDTRTYGSEALDRLTVRSEGDFRGLQRPTWGSMGPNGCLVAVESSLGGPRLRLDAHGLTEVDGDETSQNNRHEPRTHVWISIAQSITNLNVVSPTAGTLKRRQMGMIEDRPCRTRLRLYSQTHVRRGAAVRFLWAVTRPARGLRKCDNYIYTLRHGA